jgi:hypothetical protein
MLQLPREVPAALPTRPTPGLLEDAR